MDYQTASLQLAQAQGAIASLAQAKSLVDTAENAMAALQSQAGQALLAAQQAMGSTSPLVVGVLSVIDVRASAERQAGKASAITYIQANPACAEGDAINAWNAGASPTIPTGMTQLLNNPTGLLEAYIANAHSLGATPDTTWASFAAFVCATPAATLLAM
jgi:hypothetical protein